MSLRSNEQLQLSFGKQELLITDLHDIRYKTKALDAIKMISHLQFLDFFFVYFIYLVLKL